MLSACSSFSFITCTGTYSHGCSIILKECSWSASLALPPPLLKLLPDLCCINSPALPLFLLKSPYSFNFDIRTSNDRSWLPPLRFCLDDVLGCAGDINDLLFRLWVLSEFCWLLSCSFSCDKKRFYIEPTWEAEAMLFIWLFIALIALKLSFERLVPRLFLWAASTLAKGLFGLALWGVTGSAEFSSTSFAADLKMGCPKDSR